MARRARLWDEAEHGKPHPRFRPELPHALVHVPRVACPRCTGPLHVDVARQDALLWMHGHGGTHRIERRACPACLWHAQVDVVDERPPR